jgi:TPR repeat protein
MVWLKFMDLKSGAKLGLVSTVAAVSLGAGIYLESPSDAIVTRQNDPVIARQLSEAALFLKKKDYSAAAERLRVLAGSDSAEAKFLYARLLARGWGTGRDLNAARDYLLQALSTGFENQAQAAFELGKLYRISRGEDCHELAFEWFKKALAWGERKAHPKLAASYAKALGTSYNFELAKRHYRADALAGSADSAVKLVELVESGLPNHPGNKDAALILLLEFQPTLQQAGHFGDARAARSLARLYLKDSLQTRDLERAVYWLSEASRLGDPIAMHDLALLADKEKGDVFEGIDTVSLLIESSDRNYSAAYTALGRFHLVGKYSLEPEKAPHWFEQGAKAGHPGAMEELSKLYFHGKFVSKNREKARELARQGAKLRHKGSIKFLRRIEAALSSSKTNQNSRKG